MTEELHRYRALAIALCISVVLCVLIFVVFLQLEMSRARVQFEAQTSAAAARGEAFMARLLSSVILMAEHNGDLPVTVPYMIQRLQATDLRSVISEICERRQSDSVMQPGMGVSEAFSICAVTPTLEVPVESGWGDSQGQVSLLVFEDDRQASTTLIPPSVGGSRHALAMQVLLAHDRRLLVRLDNHALVSAFRLASSAGEQLRGSTCLSLKVEDRFLKLRCLLTRDEHRLTAEEQAMPGMQVSVQESLPSPITEVLTVRSHGLEWRADYTPGAALMATSISTVPLLAFVTSVIFCGLICWFVYAAVARTQQLDRQNRKLAALLEQLEGQHQDLDQFASLAAHDLQAPLRFMVAAAHMLDEELSDEADPELRALSSRIINQGSRMQSLIRGLLAFCRAGQGRLRIEPLDIRALIEEQVEGLRQQPEWPEASVRIHQTPDIIRCDRERIAQVLKMLLDNALRFTATGRPAVVDIRVDRDEPWQPWQFVIQDNGRGIASEHLSQVFRPFSRLDDNSERTGIGLAIARKLVEFHGGQIKMQSEPGVGTRVTFTLPEQAIEVVS